MKDSIHYQFYFSRLGITLESFLDGITTVEDAINKFDAYNLVGYEVELITSFIESKNVPPVVNTKKPQRRARKTSSSRNTGGAKKKTTRTRKKTTKEKSSEKKDDSSYFETWKVPYVEP